MLRAASALSSASTSCSETPSGRASGIAARIDAGTASSISASRLGRPTKATILSRSSTVGPMWRVVKGAELSSSDRLWWVMWSGLRLLGQSGAFGEGSRGPPPLSLAVS